MTDDNAPLTSEEAATLLHLLATDHTFRAAFQASPATALQQISSAAAQAAATCRMPGPLARPDILQEAHDQLISVLTSASMFSHPFCFVDGGVTST